MSRVKINFFANLAGSGWTALVGLACTPLYIKFLGMEAYGLIGFYFMLQGVVQMFDLGLSPTMNREMARYSVTPGKAGEARDFVRTLEIGYWAVGVLIGAAIYLAAPCIATHWIKAGDIPVEDVRRAVAIMGVLAALQWPLSLYQGGLLGLQRQVLLNGISIVTATLSGGGALLVLWLVSPTIPAFFSWQIGVALLQATLTTVTLWRCLPVSSRPARVEPGLLRNTWRFAAGMSGITITALILTQLDKVILSNMLPLKQFGYYMLASTVSGGLMIITIPIYNTIFPKFSSLVALKDTKSIKQLYHGTCQLMAALIIPLAAVISLYSFPILLAWTRNPEAARNASLITSFLVVGTGLNALLIPMYMLQLSHGWTSIGFRTGLLLILILVPTLTILTQRYGPAGAAFAWVITNSVYMAVAIPLTHRRLLTGEALPWLARDLLPPLLCTFPLAALFQGIIFSQTSTFSVLASIGGILMTTIALSFLSGSHLRTDLLAQARLLKKRFS